MTPVCAVERVLIHRSQEAFTDEDIKISDDTFGKQFGA